MTSYAAEKPTIGHSLAEANQTLVDDLAIAHKSLKESFSGTAVPNLDRERVTGEHRRGETTLNVLEAIGITSAHRIQ